MAKDKPWLKAKKRDKSQAGKGDKYRPVDREIYEKNYEAIFGKPKETNKDEPK